MSDFLMNLARRAVGDTTKGAEIAPSPQAALAEQMALPPIAASEPAPPAISAVPPAAAAPVMREVALPPVSPPAAPASPAAAVPASVTPAVTPLEIPPQSMTTQAQPVIPASIERGDAAATLVPAAPQDADRFADLSTSDAIRVEPRPVELLAHAARASKPSAEVPAEVVVRMSPPVPAAEPFLVAPALPTPMPEIPLTLAPRKEPRSPAPSTLEPTRVERAPIERARVVPRVERPVDALVPSARREPAVSPATADSTATARQRASATRRPVDVRIGSIEVHVTSPGPAAPAERPVLAGFEEYAAIRNPVRYDGD